MSGRNKNFVSRLRQLGTEEIVLPIGGGRSISWVALQVILFFIGCLICSCCSISSYVWGSMSLHLTAPAPIHASRPTRTATHTPAALETEIETHTSTPTTTHPSELTGTPHSTETAIPATPTQPPTSTSQSPLPTPTLTSEPISTSPDTPSPDKFIEPTITNTLQPATLPPNLRIIHVEYAPPGTAWDSEHVLIENQGINDQDMTGWTLSNEKANTYFFPTGFILPGKASVRVWTKSGTDADAELYWGYEGEVWDNQSDTTYLRDNRGTVVDALGWGNVE